MRDIDKFDILMNFIIYFILWLIVSSIIAYFLKSKARFANSTFKKRLANVAPFTIVVIIFLAYKHFKNTDLRMDDVKSLFLFYSHNLLVIGQFIIVLIGFMRTKSKGFLILLINISVSVITMIIFFIFDTRGFHLITNSNIFKEIFEWTILLGPLQGILYVIGLYYIVKEFNYNSQQKNLAHKTDYSNIENNEIDKK